MQANHIIHTGVNYQQLMEFEAAISTLEQENGGSMMTSDGINLSSSHAAKQMAKNTGPCPGLLGASMLIAEIVAEATVYSDSSIISVGGGGQVSSDGGQHAAVIDLVVGNGHGHFVTPVQLKSSSIKNNVYIPANWPFDTMLTRTRAQAMKRMINNLITGSAHKKACTVRTALTNHNETNVSIVRDMMPGAPGSQDILEVSLTQASIEAKK